MHVSDYVFFILYSGMAFRIRLFSMSQACSIGAISEERFSQGKVLINIVGLYKVHGVWLSMVLMKY